MQKPKCFYFGQCGGCATQHLPYEVQLENKKQRLIQTVGFDDVEVFSDDEWNYRNRMDMIFTEEGIGFREKGKWWSTLTISNCPISNDKLNQLNIEICDFFKTPIDYFHVRNRVGTFKYAVIRTPQNDSCISFVVNKESPRLEEGIEKVKAFADKTSANNILITYESAKSSQSIGEDYEVIKGGDMLEETILGKTFHYSAQGFFQNNHAMTESLHHYVHNLLKTHCGPNGGSYCGSNRGSQYEPQPRAKSMGLSHNTSHNGNHLLDLYGGVGAFGIINADLFSSVISVESYEGCTRATESNIERNGIENMKAVCMDAKRLKQLDLPSPLTVITDPPRAGMHPETIIELKKLRPELIIYISCNVEQLGKDLPKFTDYTIKSAAVFDLFPQTNHMESVIELVKQ